MSYKWQIINFVGNFFKLDQIRPVCSVTKALDSKPIYYRFAWVQVSALLPSVLVFPLDKEIAGSFLLDPIVIG